MGEAGANTFPLLSPNIVPSLSHTLGVESLCFVSMSDPLQGLQRGLSLPLTGPRESRHSTVGGLEPSLNWLEVVNLIYTFMFGLLVTF